MDNLVCRCLNLKYPLGKYKTGVVATVIFTKAERAQNLRKLINSEYRIRLR